MAAIPVRTFATLTQNFAAGVQGRARALVDFSEGAVLRAVAEATSDLTLWLQSLIVYVLMLTRAATSKGADLDTWMADWFFTRLPARAATGFVTVSRLSGSVQAVAPVGMQVQTADGSLIFAVYADPNVSGFSADLGGYILAPDTLSLDVPVQAVMPAGAANGSAWNVVRGQIALIRSSDAFGLDRVTNGAPFTTGQDAEKDPAFRSRFRLFIAGLAKATRTALQSAIANLGLGLQPAFVEFREPNGRRSTAVSTVFVDDGSGAPSAALVQEAASAVARDKAFGVRIAVVGAARLPASVEMTAHIADGYSQPAVVAAITKALTVYINGLGLGQPLRYTRLVEIAYDASPGVFNVTGVSLNGLAADLVPTPGQTVKASNVNVVPAV